MPRLLRPNFGAYVLAFVGVLLSFCPLRVALAGELIDIYRKAQASDHEIKGDEYVFKGSQQFKAIGRSALLPSLSLVSGQSRERRVVDYGVSGFPQRSSQVNTSSSLVLVQPILNFPVWYDYLRLIALDKKGQLDFDAAQQNLLVRISQLYLSVLKTESQLKLFRQEEAAYREFLEFAKSRLKAGMASVIDVHEAEAAFNSSKINTINASSAALISQVELEVVLGGRYPVLYSISEQYPYQKYDFHLKRTLVDTAIQKNLSLGAQKLHSESLLYAEKNIRATRYPRVELRLSYGVSTESISGGYQNSSLETTGSVVSLNLTFPLFAGGGTSAAARKANSDYKQSLELEQLLWRKINASIESALISIESKKNSLGVYAASIDSNESGLSATVAGYKLGVKNLSDVLISQRLLYQARREQRRALFDLIFDTLLLKQACGILSESDLIAIDQWLVLNPA